MYPLLINNISQVIIKKITIAFSNQQDLFEMGFKWCGTTFWGADSFWNGVTFGAAKSKV